MLSGNKAEQEQRAREVTKQNTSSLFCNETSQFKVPTVCNNTDIVTMMILISDSDTYVNDMLKSKLSVSDKDVRQ